MIFYPSFLWIVWIFNGIDYEQWEAQLIYEDIEHAIATSTPNHKLILMEAQWYPYTASGCDVLQHEVRHIELMYQGYSSSIHHAIMIVEGTYC